MGPSLLRGPVYILPGHNISIWVLHRIDNGLSERKNWASRIGLKLRCSSVGQIVQFQRNDTHDLRVP